jgi:hypothetical protein
MGNIVPIFKIDTGCLYKTSCNEKDPVYTWYNEKDPLNEIVVDFQLQTTLVSNIPLKSKMYLFINGLSTITFEVENKNNIDVKLKIKNYDTFLCSSYNLPNYFNRKSINVGDLISLDNNQNCQKYTISYNLNLFDVYIMDRSLVSAFTFGNGIDNNLIMGFQ